MAKLPQLPRKFDKGVMEEAASIIALLLSPRDDVMAEYPISIDVLQTHFVEPFTSNSIQNLILSLQSLPHDKPEHSTLEDVPLLGHIINQQVRESDLATTGLPKTELINAEIEKTEFLPFEQKIEADT